MYSVAGGMQVYSVAGSMHVYSVAGGMQVYSVTKYSTCCFLSHLQLSKNYIKELNLDSTIHSTHLSKGQTDKQTNRQTDRQTDRQTYNNCDLVILILYRIKLVGNTGQIMIHEAS